MPATEGQLVAADAIVRALGVTDGPAFDALMEALRDDQGLTGLGTAVFSMAGGAEQWCVEHLKGSS